MCIKRLSLVFSSPAAIDSSRSFKASFRIQRMLDCGWRRSGVLARRLVSVFCRFEPQLVRDDQFYFSDSLLIFMSKRIGPEFREDDSPKKGTRDTWTSASSGRLSMRRGGSSLTSTSSTGARGCSILSF